MGDMSRNFSRWEFACQCGCGYDRIEPELVDRLQKVRARFGPLTINSACRCEKHNRQIGGRSNSAHLAGLACDLRCANSFSRFYLVKHLIDEGFSRIGVGHDFIHVDIDAEKPQSLLWLY